MCSSATSHVPLGPSVMTFVGPSDDPGACIDPGASGRRFRMLLRAFVGLCGGVRVFGVFGILRHTPKGGNPVILFFQNLKCHLFLCLHHFA
jgi:hypothetical protein